MKKLPVVVMLIASLTLVACGGGGNDNTQTIFVTQILSDATFDGDIALAPVSGATYTVRQGNTQSVLAGIDPVTNVETRAFLDFPLGGSGGVPLNAIIVSAALDIVINSINPQPLTGTIPIRIDLVAFQPPDLLGTDFDRTLQPALKSLTIQPPISQSDFGNHVTVDVTAFMNEAQRLGLPDFQVRIMEDLGFVTPGVIEINDTTGPNRPALAPLLQVTYF
jgi:hypothetical protein